MLPGKLMLVVFSVNYPLLIWMDLIDGQNFYLLFLPIFHSNSKFVHHLESNLKKKKMQSSSETDFLSLKNVEKKMFF